MQFDFATSNRIVFGEGSVRELPAVIRSLGLSRVLVATGRGELPDSVSRALGEAGTAVFPFHGDGEPDIHQVLEGVQFARILDCDGVISCGGGSAIDLGKAIAAVATNPGDLLDYLEVVGKGLPLQIPPLPMIAVPTTAGTGSEVTRNAVISVPDEKMKVSLRSPLMLPRVAIVDPELTFSLPPELTASTGMDALTQLIEPYVSIRANELTDLFCREGMKRAAGALLRAYQDGNDREARTEMAYASLLGGLALANAGLGAVHGFASPIGGMFVAPHGAVCARLLPAVMRMNVTLLQQKDSPVLQRYAEIGRILTGNPQADGMDAAGWLSGLCTALEIPPLAKYGIQAEHYPAIAASAANASSMKANPVHLSVVEMIEILQMSE